MRLISLQSGSNGNCVYVETEGVRLLVDAGISGIKAAERLAQYDRDIRQVDAVLISHDHSDHTRCVGVYHRKFGLPVYLTRQTLQAAARWNHLGRLNDVTFFDAGSTLAFGAVRVETIPTPHDGVDGVAFVVDDGQSRIGILTDLGHVFDDLGPAVASLDAVLLESNYDPQMLATGRYPAFLKQRIRGPGGHLSNGEAAELVMQSATSRLRWACLGHLSEDNNRPELALNTWREVLGPSLPLHVAGRHAPTEVLEV
jgi:phosphoribosyl 1,2-cyclic phosphodiesterase